MTEDGCISGAVRGATIIDRGVYTTRGQYTDRLPRQALSRGAGQDHSVDPERDMKIDVEEARIFVSQARRDRHAQAYQRARGYRRRDNEGEPIHRESFSVRQPAEDDVEGPLLGSQRFLSVAQATGKGSLSVARRWTEAREITKDELAMLLKGIDLWREHRELRYTTVL